MANEENLNNEDDSNFEEELINDYIDYAASVLGVDSLEDILQELAHIRNVNLLKMSLDYRTALAYEDLAEAIREVATAINGRPAGLLPPFPGVAEPVVNPTAETEKETQEEPTADSADADKEPDSPEDKGGETPSSDEPNK